MPRYEITIFFTRRICALLDHLFLLTFQGATVYDFSQSLIQTLEYSLLRLFHNIKMLSNLHFLSDTTFYDAEKPYQVFVQLPPGAKTSNCQTTNHSVDLLDVRGNENEFTLDHQGFKFVKHPSTAARNLACSPQIGNQDIVKYLDEVIALLKHEFNTKHIVCFDWRVSLLSSPQHADSDSCPGLDTQRRILAGKYRPKHICRQPTATNTCSIFSSLRLVY